MGRPIICEPCLLESHHGSLSTNVDVCWYITLYPRIVICKPRATNITARFENCVLNNVSHLWETVLEFVGHEKPRESSSNSKYFDFPWLVGKVGAELEGIV